MRTVLFAALIFAVTPACELEICPTDAGGEGAGVAATQDGIIGGAVDDQNRSTVALLFTREDGATGLCSGTVVATAGSLGYVLTAAHCVQGEMTHVYEATDWRDCAVEPPGAACGAAYQPISWHAHPAYDPQTFSADVAMVVFEGATPATAVTPMVEGADDVAVGDLVTLSGYGRTYSGPHVPDAFQTLRNRVDVNVASELPTHLRFDGTTGKTACFGDSGGPAYADVGGARRVVGVASTGDAMCEKVATYARVSAYYEDFLAPLLPPPGCRDCGGGGAPSGEGGAGGSTSEGGGGSADGGAGAGGTSAEGGASGEGSAPPGDDTEPTAPTLDRCIPLELRCSVSHAPMPSDGWPGVVLLSVAWLGLRVRRRAAV